MSDTPNLNLVIVYIMRLFKFNIKYSSTLFNVLDCLYNENLLLVFTWSSQACHRMSISLCLNSPINAFKHPRERRGEREGDRQTDRQRESSSPFIKSLLGASRRIGPMKRLKKRLHITTFACFENQFCCRFLDCSFYTENVKSAAR